jgi:hypothetical protein
VAARRLFVDPNQTKRLGGIVESCSNSEGSPVGEFVKRKTSDYTGRSRADHAPSDRECVQEGGRSEDAADRFRVTQRGHRLVCRRPVDQVDARRRPGARHWNAGPRARPSACRGRSPVRVIWQQRESDRTGPCVLTKLNKCTVTSKTGATCSRRIPVSGLADGCDVAAPPDFAGFARESSFSSPIHVRPRMGKS